MFITFEGIDGCGKSTQVQNLANYLDSIKKEYLLLREPGGTDFSEEIRNLLLHSKNEINSISELLLFEAARADLVEKKIKPALDAGKIVICDRFFDSTTAYQGYGRKMNKEQIKMLNLMATANLKPDKTFFLDVSLEVSNERRSSQKKDRIEKAGAVFFQNVRKGFQEIAESEPERFVQINAEQEIDTVYKEILSHLSF